MEVRHSKRRSRTRSPCRRQSFDEVAEREPRRKTRDRVQVWTEIKQIPKEKKRQFIYYVIWDRIKAIINEAIMSNNSKNDNMIIIKEYR